MSPWMIHSMIAAATTSIALVIVNLYLWQSTRRLHYRYWLISWLLYLARYLLDLYVTAIHSTPLLATAVDAAAGCAGLMLLVGLVEMLGWSRRLIPVATGLVIGAIAWSGFINLMSGEVGVAALPVFTLLGISQTLIGFSFLTGRAGTRTRVGKAFGLLMLLWGLHKLNYPVLRNIPALAPHGYAIAAFLTMSVALLQVVVSLEDTRLRNEVLTEEIRLSRDSYISLLGAFPNPIWRATPDGDCDYFNRAWLEWTGRSMEQERGFGWTEGVHPDDLALCKDEYLAHLARREPFCLTYRLRKADGSYGWLLDYGSPIVDLAGNFAGYIGSCYDITEQRAAASSVEAQRAQLLALFSSVEEPVYVVDPATYEFVYYNESLVKAVRREPDAGEKCYAYIQGRTTPCLSCPNASLLAAPDKSYRWENRMDATDRIYTQTDRLLTWPDGRTVHFALAVDITEVRQATEQLAQESERLAVTLDSIGDAVVAVDLDQRITLFNRQAEEVTGWRASEALGRPLEQVFQVIGEATGRPIECPTRRALATGEMVGLLDGTVLLTHDGQRKAIADSAAPIRGPHRDIFGAILVFRDISEKRASELRLRDSEERFRLLAENARDMIYRLRIEPELITEYVSPAAIGLLGYAPEDFYADPLLAMKVISRDDRQSVADVFAGRAAIGYPPTVRMVRKDGTVVWTEQSITLVRDSAGRIVAIEGIARDITERRQMEDQLRHLSMHDSLTGLFNRTFFESEMRRLEDEPAYPVTIVCSDIDGLKLINDTLGHARGDLMLTDYAEVLRTASRSRDTVARIGGDEFAILMPNTSAGAAERLCVLLERQLASYPERSDGVPLGASIGYATADSASTSLSDLFNQADKNMYKEKIHRTTTAAHGVVKALLNALAEKDEVSSGHVSRVMAMAKQLGVALGLGKRDLSDLILLAEVHDLGKVGVPDRILFKPGRLTEAEQEEMRQHSVIGYRIARSSTELAHIANLILHHHEWWDGRGYPEGLRGADIPIACRILAVVDAFDAMTNDRPYRRSMPAEKAEAQIRQGAGTQFDPEIVPIFLSLTERTIALPAAVNLT
jgi:diguanylate cyclase (GGDEF)-like protein/PAS domain S-box-containing protein